MNHRHSSLVLALAAALLAPAPGRAETAGELDRQLAREPAELTSVAGRTVRGILDGYRDGRLHLRLATDGGEVGYSFAPAQIARLTWPGLELEADALELLERGEITQAMPLLEALGRHRIRYLPVLDASRQRVLWELARHGGTAGDPHAVGGIVRAMTPLADTAEKRAILLEAELEIALRTRAAEEVRALAGRWCSLADPAGRSALGWRVLARLAYDTGDYERARWLALQPVTFAGHLPMRDLDRCYALAIAAADRMGDGAHARMLHREMGARHLAWPDDPAFADIGSHYAASDRDGPANTFFAPVASTPAPAAPKAAGTLDQVRKLATTPPSP